MPKLDATGTSTRRWLSWRWPVACGMWLLLQVAQAAAAMQGLPLMRHFGAGELPAAPFYSDVAIDAQGTLYAGSREGVMVFRSGQWELFELPRRASVYSMLGASDGRLYVAGNGVLGELQRRADGSLNFIDLLPRLQGEVGTTEPAAAFYMLQESARGIHVRSADTLYLLRPDGGMERQTLPPGTAQRLFTADGVLHVRIAGSGVCRIDETGVVPLPGTDSLDHLRISGLWAWQGGMLYATSDGFHYGDAGGVRKLASDADAVFARHPPYSSIRLPDGGFVFGASDGALMRFSPDLRLHERFMMPGNGSLNGFELDRDGGLWVVGESGLARLRLPSPWSVYDARHGLLNRLRDSTWYDGSLWVAALGLWRATPGTHDEPRFQPQPWSNLQLEVFAVQGTEAGLVVGERQGLMVLDPGASQPRRLVGAGQDAGVLELLPSVFEPGGMLAVGNGQAWWLVLRDGRWQVAARWPSAVGAIDGLAQTAPGEVWLGDREGGAHRWRFDPVSGQLHEQRRFGEAQGLPLLGRQQAVHLVHLDDVLYAVLDTDVHRLEGERFVPAELPMLPALERPWELESAATAAGSFVWTSRQLWWRRPGQREFRLQQAGDSRVPGFSRLSLQADGRVRLMAWDRLLQLDPTIDLPSSAPLQARLDQLQLRQPNEASSLLPLHAADRLVLPPGSGLALRFGLATMEPNPEFRYRMSGYNEAWSQWRTDRDLGYRRLPPGDYDFELQARALDGRQAEPLRYRLRVEPFWYERGMVQALLWIAGVLVVVLALHLRNRGVTTRNRELEKRIAERTEALEAANLRLTELAVVDGLTGIANRHAMEQALRRGWQRCGERGEPLAVVMTDVDHFKAFNDNHGHQAGDMQLRRVAAVLAAEASGVDELAARYGGEEFVLILPGVTRRLALQRAERVRQRVMHAMAVAGMPGSISLGVAIRVPLAGDGSAQLVWCADRALYRAKHGGRNRVECADEADFDAAARALVLAGETVARPPGHTLSSAP